MFGIEITVARNFKQISQLTIPLEIRDFQIQILQKRKQQQHGTDYFNRKCVQYLYICLYEAGSDKKKKSFGQIN